MFPLARLLPLLLELPATWISLGNTHISSSFYQGNLGKAGIKIWKREMSPSPVVAWVIFVHNAPQGKRLKAV